MSFQPGESGNPNGRPKKAQSLTALLNLTGEELNEGSSLTRKEALCNRLWVLALSGDTGAIKYIFDRIDGKPIVSTESHEESGGLRIVLSNTGDTDMGNVEVYLGR